MHHFVYLGLLAGCLVITAPLEIVLRTGVYRRWRRLLFALVPVCVFFGVGDMIAVAHGAWSYNPYYTIGITLPGRLPLEEVLFFLVIPTCAVLTLEAVRRRRPHWRIGDEDDSWPTR